MANNLLPASFRLELRGTTECSVFIKESSPHTLSKVDNRRESPFPSSLHLVREHPVYNLTLFPAGSRKVTFGANQVIRVTEKGRKTVCIEFIDERAFTTMKERSGGELFYVDFENLNQKPQLCSLILIFRIDESCKFFVKMMKDIMESLKGMKRGPDTDIFVEDSALSDNHVVDFKFYCHREKLEQKKEDPKYRKQSGMRGISTVSNVSDSKYSNSVSRNENPISKNAFYNEKPSTWTALMRIEWLNRVFAESGGEIIKLSAYLKEKKFERTLNQKKETVSMFDVLYVYLQHAKNGLLDLHELVRDMKRNMLGKKHDMYPLLSDPVVLNCLSEEIGYFMKKSDDDEDEGEEEEEDDDEEEEEEEEESDEDDDEFANYEWDDKKYFNMARSLVLEKYIVKNSQRLRLPLNALKYKLDNEHKYLYNVTRCKEELISLLLYQKKVGELENDIEKRFEDLENEVFPDGAHSVLKKWRKIDWENWKKNVLEKFNDRFGVHAEKLIFDVHYRNEQCKVMSSAAKITRQVKRKVMKLDVNKIPQAEEKRYKFEEDPVRKQMIRDSLIATLRKQSESGMNEISVKLLLTHAQIPPKKQQTQIQKALKNLADNGSKYALRFMDIVGGRPTWCPFGMCHTAVQLGRAQLHFLSDSFVSITDLAIGGIYEDIIAVDSFSPVVYNHSTINRILNDIARTIVHYNVNIDYSQTNIKNTKGVANCQMFTEKILNHIGEPMFFKEVNQYFDKYRKVLVSDRSVFLITSNDSHDVVKSKLRCITLPADLGKKLKKEFKDTYGKKMGNGHRLYFSTHEEIDNLYLALEEVDPDFSKNYPGTRAVLKGFDRALE